jgi:hypothetical protein
MPALKNKLYIYAASANTWPVEPQAPELKPLVKELWGKSYRRISHFIELALVGAKRCVDNSAVRIQSHCDLVFASGQGNISQVVKVTEQIFKQRQPPMPFDFMHITNNMAPFYVAQALGLSSRNLTVAHRAFAFETALELASFHLQSLHESKQYLVGAADECALPLHHHRCRLNLAPDTPLAEGSHWLLTGNDEKYAIARLEFCGFANSLDELLSQLAEADVDAHSALACGYGVNAAEQHNLARQLSLDDIYHYRQETGYHDTATAYAIASFVESADKHRNRTLIHINKTPQHKLQQPDSPPSRYCALAVTALSPR